MSQDWIPTHFSSCVTPHVGPFDPPPEWDSHETRIVHRTFLVIVYSICNGMGLPLLALHTPCKKLADTGTRFHILVVFIFEINKDANVMSESIISTLASPFNVQLLGNADSFVSHINQLEFLVNPGLRSHLLVLVMLGTPCQAISRGSALNGKRKRYGLHASPSNVWFHAYCGIHTLFQKLGDQLVVFSENVNCPNELDRQTLNQTAGFCNEMNTRASEGGTRSRLLWTSIRIAVRPSPSNSDHTRMRLPMPYQYRTTWQTLPCLRAIFPKLFWNHVSDPDSVPSYDKTTIAQCTLWNEHLEEEVLPSIEIWAMQMGITKEVVAGLLSKFPCHININVFLVKEVRSSVQTCSINMYCDNCCTILHALGEGWNVNTTSSYLHQFLYTIAFHHQAGFHKAEKFQYNMTPHVCTDDCDLARQKLV